ncbi:MAG: uL15 family ribosomal protein [Candidatus Pacebacteria bacterium]|nr:uL15 family ribosomal protein [Candidatus Paceibacterota bacterium]
MQIHELKPKTSFKKAKRIGRGGKKGTFSGKGSKGQHSRAGTRFQPLVKEWIKKYHKLRGYRFGIQGKTVITFDLNDLEKNFESGDVISPKSLIEKNLIKGTEGSSPKVKILAKGDITKSFIIERCKVSAKAKEIIESKSGQVK